MKPTIIALLFIGVLVAAFAQDSGSTAAVTSTNQGSDAGSAAAGNAAGAADALVSQGSGTGDTSGAAPAAVDGTQEQQAGEVKAKAEDVAPSQGEATDTKAEAVTAKDKESSDAASAGDLNGDADANGDAQQQAANSEGSADSKDKPAESPAKETVVSNIVALAPAVNITFGDDIDTAGKCEGELKKYCEGIDQGEAQLADCISEAITQEEVADESDENVPSISDDCREEVYQFKISRDSNINKNIPLAKACKADAEKYCNVTWFFSYKAGQVISCLRDVKDQVAKHCSTELFKVMMDAAMDFRADPILYEACKDNAETLCKGIKNGGGRIQDCLRKKRMQLSWGCEDQLFRQETESADDIRLSVRLFAKCLGDKRKFCKDIQPGSARTKDCLEEHREELSQGCREEIDDMIEHRVRDFRLDSRLRTVCGEDIMNMCAFFGDMDEMDSFDASVINCLQDYKEEIRDDACKAQVKKYVALAAQDIRFDVPLAEACYDDRRKYCGDVPPGSARVIRCLTNSRDKLTPVCRATLFDEEVRFSENIDFQYPMKAACKAEIERFCRDIPHGGARVIRCLQDNKGEKDFGKACQDEVAAYEQKASSDYRLNYRLRTACQKEVSRLCPGICPVDDDNQVCGGKVLRCLTDKQENITDEACSKEVLYFEKMEVSNFRNDVILAEACRADVDKLCANVEGGEGRVHKCLRDHRKELSEACRKEEFLLEEKESANAELSVSLLKTCATERQLFCREVKPGQASIFRCLAENINDADFGGNCRAQIISRLQRRQANWKLDPLLRKACRSDVMSLCASEDNQDSEEGLVYKCLISSVDAISAGCQKELGRAVHMAFFVYQPEAILTAECDADIKTLCLADRPNMLQRPGAVGACLSNLLDNADESAADAPSLSPKCQALVDVSRPPSTKKAFDSSLSFALLQDQLERIEGLTGLPTVTRNRQGEAQGISLTGWIAVLGLAALIVLVVACTYFGYRHLTGTRDSDGYTLVVKSAHK